MFAAIFLYLLVSEKTELFNRTGLMKTIFGIIALLGVQGVFGQTTSHPQLEQLLNQRQYYKVLRYADTLQQEGRAFAALCYYQFKASEGVMRYNDAYRYARQWYEQDTTNREARLSVARLSNLAGHKTEALRIYEQLSREDSLDFSVNYALGRLYQQTDKTGSALEVYQRQLSVDSTNVTLLTLIGDCFMEMKLVSPALSYYGKAFYKDVQNASLAVKATNAVLTNKEYIPYYADFLSHMLSVAISRAPESVNLRQTLGVLKYTDKRYDESRKIFAELRERGDSSRITLKYAGLTEFQLENFRKALPWLRKAYALYAGSEGEPTDVDLAMKYGEALCRSGDCSAALEVFKAVENRIMPDPRILSMLEVLKGMSYTYTMNRDKAIESYWNAYKLNPGNTGAIANLAYLSDRKGLDIDDVEPSDAEKKKILFAHILFLQKVKEKPNAGIDTQHGHSRQVLGEALDELFFKNENKLVVSDFDGNPHTYPVEMLRKLAHRE